MKYQVQENCLTIFLPREVDHHHAEEIRKNADLVIERNHIKYVIFDFEKTEFMDSSGIGMVLGRYRKMNETDGAVAIVSCSAAVRNILNMAGIFSLMDYMDTKEEAILYFKGKEAS